MHDPMERFLQLIRKKTEVDRAIVVLVEFLRLVPVALQDVCVDFLAEQKLNLYGGGIGVPHTERGVEILVRVKVGGNGKCVFFYCNVLEAGEGKRGDAVVVEIVGEHVPVAFLAEDMVGVCAVLGVFAAVEGAVGKADCPVGAHCLEYCRKGFVADCGKRVRDERDVLADEGRVHGNFLRKHVRELGENVFDGGFQRRVPVLLQKRLNHGDGEKFRLAQHDALDEKRGVGVKVAVPCGIIFQRRVVSVAQKFDVAHNRGAGNFKMLAQTGSIGV